MRVLRAKAAGRHRLSGPGIQTYRRVQVRHVGTTAIEGPRRTTEARPTRNI